MNFLSKISHRERFFLYIIAIGALLLLVDQYILGVMVDEIKKIKTEVDSVRIELNKDVGFLSCKDTITKETETYSKYLEKEESPQVELQKLMNTLGVQSSLTINEIKPVSTKDANKYVVELKAEGETESLITFLYNLSLVHSLLKAEKMDLGPKTPKSKILTIYLIISKTTIP